MPIGNGNNARSAFGLIITLICLLGHSVLAHDQSWNKARISVLSDTVTLKLSIVQSVLLDVMVTDSGARVASGTVPWATLMPLIRSYVFDDVLFKVNGTPVTGGADLDWQIGDAIDSNDGMESIQISRQWYWPNRIESIAVAFNLLQNVTVPVKCFVEISRGNTDKNRYYEIIERGATIAFDFRTNSWGTGQTVSSAGGEVATPWTKFWYAVKGGVSRFSLENAVRTVSHPGVILLYFLVAIVIGAFHSLSPGHGKALIGAYIVGTKGTVRDAVMLGVVTAVRPTASVLLLGVILMLTFDAVVPQAITRQHNVASAAIILAIGIYLFVTRLRDSRRGHAHDHGPGHSHQHITVESIQKSKFWADLMMGISGGIVPCPTALVVIFLAISLKKLVVGLLLISFFSLGLAATLTLLGILIAKGSGMVNRYDNSRIVPMLPIISAVVIVLLGLGMLGTSLFKTL
jgi:ABC-type nickel/cobalt efflux system permease component RcnA